MFYKKAFRILLLLLFCGLCNACAVKKTTELKSPCASANNGPCERRAVNDWWVEDYGKTGRIFS